MDLLQQLVGVFVVLGGLGALLWWARTKGWASTSLSGLAHNTRAKELKILERLVLSAQHSLVLVDASGERLLVCLSPGASTVTRLTADHKLASVREVMQ